MNRKASKWILISMVIIVTCGGIFSSSYAQFVISVDAKEGMNVVLVHPKISKIKIVNEFRNPDLAFHTDIKVEEVIEKLDDAVLIRASGKVGYVMSMTGSLKSVAGLPNTRMDISGLKEGLYYAGRLWYPLREGAYIICTEKEIVGVNIKLGKLKKIKRRGVNETPCINYRNISVDYLTYYSCISNG